jgi:hypothetical protein
MHISSPRIPVKESARRASDLSYHVLLLHISSFPRARAELLDSSSNGFDTHTQSGTDNDIEASDVPREGEKRKILRASTTSSNRYQRRSICSTLAKSNA